MGFDTFRYVIINTSDITDVMRDSSLGGQYPRTSKDSSKVIFKFEGNTPPCFSGKTIYTHSEIISELDNQSVWG